MNATAAANAFEPENHRYRLIAPIARGGMAELYLAATQGHNEFSKLVAVKRVWPELAHEADFAAMFMDEARLAVRLNHPNVVQTFEVGHMDGRLFMAMEFLEGQPLHTLLTRLSDPARFALPLRLKVLSNVLSGLHYAHQLAGYNGAPLGVVHRDVCPQNIFVTYEGGVKLLDFGIAKSLAASHHTRPGVMKGRVAYMSPEQIRGEQVDRRADIFSVGVMLWEAATNRRFWQGETETSIIRKLCSSAELVVPALPEDAPAGLEAICRKALSIHRNHRFATAAEMQIEIDRLIAGSTDSYDRQLAAVVSYNFRDEQRSMQELMDRGLRGLPLDQSHQRYTPLSSMSLPRLTGVQDEVPTVSTDAPPLARRNKPLGRTVAAGCAAIVGLAMAGLSLKYSPQRVAPPPVTPAVVIAEKPTVIPAVPTMETAKAAEVAPTIAPQPARHKHKSHSRSRSAHRSIGRVVKDEANKVPTIRHASAHPEEDPFDLVLVRKSKTKHTRTLDDSNPYR